VVAGAASDGEVVVREIKTTNHGTYYAVVNTSMLDKKAIAITLPATGPVTDLVSAQPLSSTTFDFYPGQLLALHVGDFGSDAVWLSDDGGVNDPMPQVHGCGCRISDTSGPSSGAFLLLAVAILCWARSSKRPGRPNRNGRWPR